MSVKDLIEYLKNFDPEFEVFIEKDFASFTFNVEEIVIHANSRNNPN
jgi:hypothetical protein